MPRPPRGVLDFALISGKAQPLARGLEVVTDVPWAPHFGIRLVMCVRPFEIRPAVLWRPPPRFGRRHLRASERRGGAKEERRSAERPSGRLGGTLCAGGEGLEARGENRSVPCMPPVTWQQASRMADIPPSRVHSSMTMKASAGW